MKPLIIIDLSSFIFRAFYAIRPLSSPSGVPVNALLGVLNMLIKVVEKYGEAYYLVARDNKQGSHYRKHLYPAYKANRQEPPADLIPQFELIERLVPLLQLREIWQEGVEADDLIATAVKTYGRDVSQVVMISGDKDLLQLVGDNVVMWDTMKEILYSEKEVFQKLSVYPNQVADYLAIVGDTSDNIPGIKGIGPKGAEKLLSQFGNLENLLNQIDKIENSKLQQTIMDQKELAILSKKLTTLQFLPSTVSIPLNELNYNFRPTDALYAFLDEFGLKNAKSKLQSSFQNQKEVLPAIVPITDPNVIENTLNDLNLSGEIAIIFDFDKIRLEIFVVDKNYYLETDRLDIIERCLLKLYSNHKIQLITRDSQTDLKFLLCNSSVPIWRQLKTPNDLSLRANLLGISFKNLSSHTIFSYGSLAKEYQAEMEKFDLLKVYEQLDLKLAPILALMEFKGIGLDILKTKNLEQVLTDELNSIENEIEELSKQKVNLRSPKQVGKLLFEDLKYPVIKMNKTGYATDAEVLEALTDRGYTEIPKRLLTYREVEKLLSTYVKVLPELINPATNRIHTHFHQDGTETGRLSSDHPNLQNIPVRTLRGQKVRGCFVAQEGHVLLSADYSQIELRILAHFSQDPTMVQSFHLNKDIHAQTASEIFSIPVEKVKESDRDLAKAVNFGLMYGQSSFGLSQNLKIPRSVAKDYITHYFARFSKVKSYLDSLREFCETTGYSQTLMGRKRFLPDIHSSNRTIKAQAERMSINTPIQGSAADIIKLSMISIDRQLAEKELSALMLLQVHDELIFEVPRHELELVAKMVKEVMENVVALNVPLKVNLSAGADWLNMEDISVSV